MDLDMVLWWTNIPHQFISVVYLRKSSLLFRCLAQCERALQHVSDQKQKIKQQIGDIQLMEKCCTLSHTMHCQYHMQRILYCYRGAVFYHDSSYGTLQYTTDSRVSFNFLYRLLCFLVCDDAKRVEGEEGTHGMSQHSDNQIREIPQDPKFLIL